MDQDKQEKSVSIESNQNSKQDEQQDSESSQQDEEQDSEDLQEDEQQDSESSKQDDEQDSEDLQSDESYDYNIVLNIKSLKDDKIEEYRSQFVGNSYIDELTIDFTYLENQENDMKFQMKKIGEIIQKVRTIEIITIKFYFSDDFFEDLGDFFEQMNKENSFHSKLNMRLKQDKSQNFLKFNNLYLFGQIIGINHQISQLYLDLSDIKIKSDKILIIIQEISIQNMCLKQLEINFKENNFEASKLQYLKEIFSNFNGLKDLKLQLDILDIKDEEKQIINDMASINLQKITFYLKFQQRQYLNIILENLSIKDINKQCFGTQIINQSKDLISLDIKFTDCASNLFINCIQQIFQIQNLMILNLELDLSIIEYSCFKQLGNNISNCIKLSLDLTKREISSFEMTKLSQILACTKNLLFLKIDLQYLKKGQVSDLIIGVNKCQQLRNLTIRAEDFDSQICHKYFHKLTNNKFLNSLKFIFKKISKYENVEEDEEAKKDQECIDRGYDGRFGSSLRYAEARKRQEKRERQKLGNEDDFIAFKRNMTNIHAFKKNIRFIKVEILYYYYYFLEKDLYYQR